MNLLKYENYKITISDDAYLVKSIRNLFNSDKTKLKERFFDQMTFLYFFADVRSDYSYIDDEDERKETIIKEQGLSSDFKITNELKKAIDDYIRLTTTVSAALLQDSKIAVNKVRAFLRDLDLNQVDDRGKPIYTINTVTTALKQIPELAKNIQDAEKIVAKEIEEAGRARGGNNKKSLFEEGDY